MNQRLRFAITLLALTPLTLVACGQASSDHSDATAIQTVGSKGYDRFAIAIVAA